MVIKAVIVRAEMSTAGNWRSGEREKKKALGEHFGLRSYRHAGGLREFTSVLIDCIDI
jgi:hypothetical protein